MIESVMAGYESAYSINKTMVITVNRLGDYRLTAKTYDRYNNMFTNVYDNVYPIKADSFDINFYTHTTSSDNDREFYAHNTFGAPLTKGDLEELEKYDSPKPIFPRNYTIYDIDYDSKAHTLEFDNLSYAIDTPKNNYYLILDNYTEQVDKLSAKNGEDDKR